MTPSLYTVRHHYRYVYSAPIRDVRQRLVMIPPDHHADQHLVSYDLDVRGASGGLSVEWHIDQFGNRVYRIEAERVEHALDFEAHFSVRRPCHLVGPGEVEPFLGFTALTAPGARVKAVAREIACQTSDSLERAELAHDWAARAITYRLGVTGTQTPAAMALHLGQGVCQDYAHILLSLLRCLGTPGRYVSGHLLGDGAPHAWVEAILDDAVIAYDPTHHRRAGPNYITVATGRDFADVTTTSGVFTGTATGKLHWSMRASLADTGADVADTGAEAAA